MATIWRELIDLGAQTWSSSMVFCCDISVCVIRYAIMASIIIALPIVMSMNGGLCMMTKQ